MKRLILAEKPSVARDIASALCKSLNKDASKKGYFECKEKNLYITWALGHLVEIDDEIAPRKWSLETLPILPETFKYKVIDKTSNQFKVISKLLKEVDEVVIATDAGREGELIARLILMLNHFKGSVKRFWTSDALTKEVIIREMENLKDASLFDSLYYSALARSHADWIVGINLTRLMTVKAGGGVWSVGRVQTPTLKLIVDRYKEFKDFIPKEYYVIKAIFSACDDCIDKSYVGLLVLDKAQEKTYKTLKDALEEEDPEKTTGVPKSRYFTPLLKESKDEIIKKLEKVKEGIVKDVKITKRKENPPLLHSLTSLQREANRIYGYSSMRTLNIAQKLYESYKCLSYPRTDSNYLGEDQETKNLVKNILKKLVDKDTYEFLSKNINKVGKRVFDSSKLTDHHALIPFGPIPEDASVEEKNIYNLVFRRFVGAFMEPYEYAIITIKTILEEFTFISNINIETLTEEEYKKTYLSLYKPYKLEIKESLSEDEDIEPQNHQEKERNAYNTLDFDYIKSLKPDDKVYKRSLEALQKFTKPPVLYTEGTLLRVMEKLGLGTPATRASIIETLLERKYISRVDKSLLPTLKGEELIKSLRDSDVSKPEMTTTWEEELERIYKERKSKEGYIRFMHNIKEFVSDNIDRLKFVEMKRVPMATKKMIEFARSLARSKNIKPPHSTDYETIKAFIEEHSPKKEENTEENTNGYTPPTEKQIAFAKDLAKKLNQEIPEDAYVSTKTMSEWIKNAIKQTGYKKFYRRGKK
ncbi:MULTISPECIES: DNA topoisomerase [unclassified Hydrogenobaculum]|uniref:DNA topoisomerase n=1 Tax=unclassified Hydrogenobaculum TaxID=2622382 RepID=UPI0001C521E6|nr:MULTISPECIES: DNA topoisomerase [unclassified Hydrogenobaculum]AEF19404.1 DNA topoisomerase [Hydrogenobaculum sp. 3684]AEG46693.1 DNA topoisomerase [Hydrogenobaculum sp. SHO]AGG15337.1 DNA topoisomerase type IA central domain protein [Hydrogenobaculum sp. HO]AGH93639.1 topoisomerase IA [Hydrogenobaculum sp. SN]